MENAAFFIAFCAIALVVVARVVIVANVRAKQQAESTFICASS